MEGRIFFPRLTKWDCERLASANEQLAGVRDALAHSNWAGAHMAANAITPAQVVLCELYNRAERAFLRAGVSQPGPSFQDGQAEQLAAAEPAPGAAARDPEPGK